MANQPKIERELKGIGAGIEKASKEIERHLIKLAEVLKKSLEIQYKINRGFANEIKLQGKQQQKAPSKKPGL